MASPLETRNDAVVSLAKRRGFVFPSGEIYGGTRSAWDYGPLGVELKENIRRQWWRAMVQRRDDIVGLDSSVILPREVWVASGHVETFTDPLTECQSCHHRFRADQLEEQFEARKGRKPSGLEEISCPHCGTKGAFTDPRQFSGLLKTYLGPVESEEGLAYLRPETAQGIFVNFKNVTTCRPAQAALRHRPDRQVVPQRDHAGQLHLPHPRVRADGDGVLRRAGHGRAVARVLAQGALGLVRRTRPGQGQPALLRARAGEALALLDPDRRHRVPVRLRRRGVRRARGHRQPHRLRPEDPLRALRHGPELPGPGERRALDAVRHRARRRDSAARRWPSCSMRTPRTRPRTPRAASTSAWSCASTRGWRRSRSPSCRCPGTPTCRRRPRRSRPSCGRAGTSTSTTPVRSAGATAARTRSVRRSASPWTSRPPTTRRSPSGPGTRWSRSGSPSTGCRGYLAERLPGC